MNTLMTILVAALTAVSAFAADNLPPSNDSYTLTDLNPQSTGFMIFGRGDHSVAVQLANDLKAGGAAPFEGGEYEFKGYSDKDLTGGTASFGPMAVVTVTNPGSTYSITNVNSGQQLVHLNGDVAHQLYFYMQKGNAAAEQIATGTKLEQVNLACTHTVSPAADSCDILVDAK